MIKFFSRPDSFLGHILKTLLKSKEEPQANNGKTIKAGHLRIQRGELTARVRRYGYTVHMQVETTGQALRASLCRAIGLTMLATVFLGPAWAQKEVTSDIYRYREREASARYYEKYEYKPRSHLPFVEEQIPQRELITLSPTAERVRRRTYLADSHWGLKFYEFRTCIRCHPQQAWSLHTKRAKITCRQCHGEEPIAGINHYYSSMHPRRRYAFVCAKCHKGSSASFATYVVHEPNPAAMRTQRTFPVLFYAFWIMIAIAAGTFAAFLPLTILWGLREFLPDTILWKLRVSPVKRMKQNDQN